VAAVLVLLALMVGQTSEVMAGLDLLLT
jgi:hypothetical protein